jgi:hypothetical protein
VNEYSEEDLIQDTKEFLASQYGKYITQILSEKAEGFLSAASDIREEHPERHLAKYSALKEVLELINLPLDDDSRTRG